MNRPAAIAVAAVGVVVAAIVIGTGTVHDERRAPSAQTPSAAAAEPSAPEVVHSDEALPTPAAPSVLARPRVSPPAASQLEKRMDETSLLAKLHELAATDPPLSLELAKQAVERFPDSPNAPEFEWNVVKALYNMGRLQDAKDEARVMLWKYPDDSFALDVEHHLLNHPPNPPGTPIER
jgi:hypothetical protein